MSGGTSFEEQLFVRKERLERILMSRSKGRRRLGRCTISEVFEYIDASPTHGQLVDFRGHKMNMRKTRLLSFRINGITCVECGTRGAFFAMEKYEGDIPHLNLYGFSKTGSEKLMTRDHIRPRSKGGTNNLYNAQTMCCDCNRAKSDKWTLRIKIKHYWRKFIFRLKYGKELL